MKQLIEDYKRRLKTVEEMSKAFESNGSVSDIQKKERLTTKASEYRTFISEMERELKNVVEHIVEKINDIQQHDVDVDGVEISNEDWFTDNQFDIIRKVSQL